MSTKAIKQSYEVHGETNDHTVLQLAQFIDVLDSLVSIEMSWIKWFLMAFALLCYVD